MRYPVLVVSFLKVSGMALFPFILISNAADKNNQTLINHEKIHLRQQAELLIIPFYLLYLIHYLVNLAIHRDHDKAYMVICFEREAYNNETDLNYLQRRKWFSWLKYL